MDLETFKSQVSQTTPAPSKAEACDPCQAAVDAAKRRQPPYNRPLLAIPSERLGQTFDGRKVVLVEDEETGLVTYRVMGHDNHLGGLEE